MHRRFSRCVLVLFLTTSACAAAPTAGSRYLNDFAGSETRGTTFPHATEVDPGLDMAGAYRLQARIVAARQAKGDRVVGYKGGLMSEKSLSDRKVSEPLVGALFRSGDLASGGEVSLCGYRRAAFEVKLGYVFSAPVRGRIDTVEALKARVASVQPVVELPDIAYRDDKTYGAIDMAAANISSAYFVRGAPQPKDRTDLDALTVSIARDGTRVTSGMGRESFGDQWGSLLRIVNLLTAQGGTIRPGQIVITGKIGDKGDLPPGEYRADYGPLGEVAFRVRNCQAG